MKSYGAIRKVMLIVLLSILGSYCIGAAENEQKQGSWFENITQSTYDIAASIGSYCSQLWSEIAGKVMTMFGKNDDQVVKIQGVDDSVHGNDANCTDGRADCIKNNIFFNNTYYLKVDKDGSMSMPGEQELDVDDQKTYDNLFVVEG